MVSAVPVDCVVEPGDVADDGGLYLVGELGGRALQAGRVHAAAVGGESTSADDADEACLRI